MGQARKRGTYDDRKAIALMKKQRELEDTLAINRERNAKYAEWIATLSEEERARHEALVLDERTKRLDQIKTAIASAGGPVAMLGKGGQLRVAVTDDKYNEALRKAGVTVVDAGEVTNA